MSGRLPCKSGYWMSRTRHLQLLRSIGIVLACCDRRRPTVPQTDTTDTQSRSNKQNQQVSDRNEKALDFQPRMVRLTRLFFCSRSDVPCAVRSKDLSDMHILHRSTDYRMQSHWPVHKWRATRTTIHTNQCALNGRQTNRCHLNADNAFVTVTTSTTHSKSDDVQSVIPRMVRVPTETNPQQVACC